MNASTLEVTSQDVTSPTPDGIHLKLVTLAKSGSSFHPTIDGFRASLSLQDKEPFFYIDIPETKAEDETNIVVEQDLTPTSMDRFKEYNMAVIGSEQFDVYLNGKTKIHQSGLSAISVNYNKKVTMKGKCQPHHRSAIRHMLNMKSGLNKLQGLNITDLKILDGTNLVGNVFIPNPSVMLIDLGNVTMNLAVDGKAIGTALIPNLVLKPGNNTLPMQSKVAQLLILGLVRDKYKDGVLPLEITGNSSMIGDKHLEYYEAAIQSNTIKLDLPVGPALQGIGVNITSFGR